MQFYCRIFRWLNSSRTDFRYPRHANHHRGPVFHLTDYIPARFVRLSAELIWGWYLDDRRLPPEDGYGLRLRYNPESAIHNAFLPEIASTAIFACL